MIISDRPDWGEEKLASSKTYARVMIALSVFVVISGLFFLIFFGLNWGEITKRGLEGTFMQVIVFSLAGLFLGTFFILQNRKRLKRISLKEQGLSEDEWVKKKQGLGEAERSTSLLASFLTIVCLNFAIGFLTNNVGFYILGIGFIFLVTNEVLARTSKRYKDSVWRVARQIVGVTVAASAVIYYAFVNVNLLVAIIGFTTIVAYFGLVLSTRYRKKTRN